VIVSNIWQEFLKIVNEEVGSRVVETWFKAVTLEQWDTQKKTAYLKAPNSFTREWITTNYQQLLQHHLGRLLNEMAVSIVFLDEVKADIQIMPAVSIVPSHNLLPPTPLALQSKKLVSPIKNPALAKSSVNHGYQFDTFVVGPNNSLAYSAAEAAAKKPGMLYNPLFIYGDSGLGKTHLLHAIGNYIKASNSKARILYQSADRFVNEFINAIRFDKMGAFEAKYKDVDVLLIDDIQFISNKEQTQEAFFHVFNALYEARKQIVFSSDSLPRDIAGLADRLRSRLDGGLVTDVQPPTLETKIAILKKKADLHKEQVADDVAHFIASLGSSNVRELEGLLIRVLAFASLTHQPVSLELAQKVLAHSPKEQQKEQTMDLHYIASKVAHHYKYTIGELRSTKRHKGITQARHVAMYLMKKLTHNSLADIGAFWRRKDHSTVIHALEKIEHHKNNDRAFDTELKDLENYFVK
jgi:chromosomal replication initiator protein